MQDITPKELMLKSIRKALIHKSDNPYPKLDFESNVYTKSDEILEMRFAEEFNKVNGEFIYCENSKTLLDNLRELIFAKKWKEIFCWEQSVQEVLNELNIQYLSDDKGLENVEVGITLCECLVARTGSILVSSKQLAGRRLTIYPPSHVVIAKVSQLVEDIGDGLEVIKNKYSNSLPTMITNVAGPSRTADIEKTLVLGAHGPKELFVLLVDDKNSSK
ncbi:MAG: hypothetical protein COC01_03025 [Bacteroidetes bacterium]|nr:MAG: hypothetical protein COC01_03025 [Bacteroidota bacterium]